MRPEVAVIASMFFVFVALEYFSTGFFKKEGEKKGDGTVELFSGLALLLITQPLVLYSAYQLAGWLFSDYKDSLESWPFISVFMLFLLFDDMTQYWWHRLSHTVPWLYKLHRPHHNANYLSIRVVYRNNFFYYLMMPGLWFSGILIYLGGGWVYAIYLTLKMMIIYGAHSDVRWDKPLYRIPWLSPVMWVVERVISTPATHSAHHGKHAADGVTHYKGNYGNMLFFWDVLFGTAKITRRYPEEMGVEDLPETTTSEQLLWPIFNAGRNQS